MALRVFPFHRLISSVPGNQSFFLLLSVPSIFQPSSSVGNFSPRLGTGTGGFFGGGLLGPSGSGAIGPFAILPDSCDSPDFFFLPIALLLVPIPCAATLIALFHPVSDGLFPYLPFFLGHDPNLSLQFFSFFLIDDLLPNVFLVPEAHLFPLQLAPPWIVFSPRTSFP